MPRNASRRRKGIRQHTLRLKPEEITKRNGLPVTTVERTLADVIGNGLADEQVRKAVREALQYGLTDREKLLRQADHAGRNVKKKIREILSGEPDEI